MDKGSRYGAASAAAATARRPASGDGPTYAKATVGRHIRAHAQELITFPRGEKTDWGKKRRIFEDLFWATDGVRLAPINQRGVRDGWRLVFFAKRGNVCQRNKIVSKVR